MTTLPQTTAIRLPRPSGQMQLSSGGGGGSTPGTAGAGSAAMSGGDVLRVLRNNIWLILFMLAFSAGAGYLANEFLAKKYPHFTTAGYISVQPNTVDPLLRKTNDVGDPAVITLEQKTQAALLRSDTLLTKILQKDSSETRKTTWFKKFNGNIALAKEDFLDNYNVTSITDTRLVKIEFTSAVPGDCQTIVKEIGSLHIADEAERIFLQGQQQSQQLSQLRSKYYSQYQEVDSRLFSLRTKVNNQGGQVLSRMSMKENQLEKLRTEQSKIEIEFRGVKSQLESVKKNLDIGVDPTYVEHEVDANPMLQQFKMRYDNSRQQFEGSRDKWGEGHPIYQQLQKQLERDKQKAEEYEAEVRTKGRASMMEQLTQNMNSMQTNLDQFTKQITDVSEELGDVTNQMVRYFALESEQKSYSDSLKQVERQLAILETEQNQKLSGKVQWSNIPEVPLNRSFPQLKYTMPISLMIGLMIALSIAFLREMTDTTIRSPRDIQRVGQMTLLGMIGDETQDPQAAGARLPLVIFDAPHSMTAEQLRQVRTRLQHAASLDTTRSIMVTSPSPGDGKTTICCNLAAGLALNGRRILLVDGNFRRPEIHKVFALANEQGFSDVLNGAVTFDEVVQETQVPNLAVMTSGPKPINSTEMFESQLLIDFIERALEEFDHVIFDTGPMMVVSESQAMAPKVDGVITVVRARTNSRGLLTRMREALKAVKAEHLGVVLNGVRAQGGGYYGSSIKTYYEYHNG